MKNIIASSILICSLITASAQHIMATNIRDTTKISNDFISYKVSQDQQNIKLNISTSDTQVIMSMLHAGITVFFDVKGKEKQSVYVKYPLSPVRPSLSRGDAASNTLQTKEAAKLKNLRIVNIIENDLPQEAEYGYFEAKEVFHTILNTQHILLKYNYNVKNGLFEYNLTIPKNKISSNPSQDLSRLKIGIKTNTLDKKQDKQRQSNVTVGGRGSRGQGAGRPGGPPPGGGQRGQQNRSPAAGETKNQSPQSIDFWFKANLK